MGGGLGGQVRGSEGGVRGRTVVGMKNEILKKLGDTVMSHALTGSCSTKLLEDSRNVKKTRIHYVTKLPKKKLKLDKKLITKHIF